MFGESAVSVDLLDTMDGGPDGVALSEGENSAFTQECVHNKAFLNKTLQTYI